jgi:hypothetical protein
LAIAGAGCSAAKSAAPGGQPASAESAQAEPSAEELLRQQLRSGRFQLNAAAGSIEQTYLAAKEAADSYKRVRDVHEGFLDVVDYVDSAGAEVSDHIEEPPTLEDITKDFATYDERRLKAVQAANDALKDLREALGVLEGLSDSPQEAVARSALSVKSLLAVAIDDLWGAVEALGGEPEGSEEPLDP